MIAIVSSGDGLVVAAVMVVAATRVRRLATLAWIGASKYMKEVEDAGPALFVTLEDLAWTL
ncbi:hypothetical protein E2C01_020166 [Portunus trituberculatus]|uniref:Uncharacterized protein n=1 Tax=Portunus trituberculatus TaxID=210409 RepID=A0A5B7E2F5_PORTR|nr:hypothetical protein [Portunus trituberculatus]